MKDEAIPGDATERLMREVFEECVPDVEQRRQIVTRVRVRDLLSEPDVAAAQRSLTTATRADLDAAFRLLARRNAVAVAPSPNAVTATPEAGSTVGDRLRQASERVKAGVVGATEAFRDLFVVTLRPATGLRGRDPAGDGADDVDVDGPQAFAFTIPVAVAQRVGLAVVGSAEIGDGVLHVRVERAFEGGHAQVTAVAIVGDVASDAVTMTSDPEDIEVLSASIDWPHPTGAPIEVLFSVQNESPPTAP